MNKFMLPINVVLEYLTRKVEWFMHSKQKPTLLALSVDTFTNEGWVDGIIRQNRLMEYQPHFNEQNQ